MVSHCKNIFCLIQPNNTRQSLKELTAGNVAYFGKVLNDALACVIQGKKHFSAFAVYQGPKQIKDTLQIVLFYNTSVELSKDGEEKKPLNEMYSIHLYPSAMHSDLKKELKDNPDWLYHVVGTLEDFLQAKPNSGGNSNHQKKPREKKGIKKALLCKIQENIKDSIDKNKKEKKDQEELTQITKDIRNFQNDLENFEIKITKDKEVGADDRENYLEQIGKKLDTESTFFQPLGKDDRKNKEFSDLYARIISYCVVQKPQFMNDILSLFLEENLDNHQVIQKVKKELNENPEKSFKLRLKIILAHVLINLREREEVKQILKEIVGDTDTKQTALINVLLKHLELAIGTYEKGSKSVVSIGKELIGLIVTPEFQKELINLIQKMSLNISPGKALEYLFHRYSLSVYKYSVQSCFQVIASNPQDSQNGLLKLVLETICKMLGCFKSLSSQRLRSWACETIAVAYYILADLAEGDVKHQWIEAGDRMLCQITRVGSRELLEKLSGALKEDDRKAITEAYVAVFGNSFPSSSSSESNKELSSHSLLNKSNRRLSEEDQLDEEKTKKKMKMEKNIQTMEVEAKESQDVCDFQVGPSNYANPLDSPSYFFDYSNENGQTNKFEDYLCSSNLQE